VAGVAPDQRVWHDLTRHKGKGGGVKDLSNGKGEQDGIPLPRNLNSESKASSARPGKTNTTEMPGYGDSVYTGSLGAHSETTAGKFREGEGYNHKHLNGRQYRSRNLAKGHVRTSKTEAFPSSAKPACGVSVGTAAFPRTIPPSPGEDHHNSKWLLPTTSIC